MSKTNEKRDARVLQDATGARYMTCLAEVRRRRAGGGAAYEKFFADVDALPDRADGDPERCVRCLGSRHAGACPTTTS